MLHSIQLSHAYIDEAANENPDLHRAALYKSILSAHGNACTGMEHYAESERLLLQAIECCMKLGMEEEWSLGNLTQNLANCYLWSSNLRKAELTANRALNQPNTNPEAAKYTMGNIMLRMGRYDEALSFHKDALATYCQTMGPDHLTSSDSWYKLGCILSIPKFADHHIEEAE